MKNYLLLALAAVALCFTACKKDNPEPKPVAVTGISLDKTMVALEIDESATVQAVITPSNATNKAVEWSIADTAVATVSNGVVTGVAVGETTLTATTADGGFTATIPVKVVTEKVAVTGIEWQNTTSNIKEGKFAFFVAEISPANATDLSTTWMSDNPEVASIGEIKIADNFIMAYIWGVAPGKATISVTTNDGGFKQYCPITIDPVVKVTEIKIGPENATIEAGETKQFAAAISPSDAENKEVEWSSSDTSVATVDANGLVTGVAKGEATITATAKDGSGVKGEATITVVDKKPTSITFDGTAPYEFYYWQGKVIDFKNDLKMKVEPADADFSVIEWGISIQSARDDVSGEEVKYEIKDDNITLSYAHSTKWNAAETVHATAYVDNVEIGSVSIIMQNRGMLFHSETGLSYYYDLAMQGNKMNWNNDNITELKYICYNKLVGSDGKYNKYQIPSSEYILTSSDESKIKVTKNDDGISWMIERLNTTDLVAVTLTYKCGEHTQTYTINLIP
ncbi:MAG: Ig-like domain-containing protein [Alistipes sp.]|nr:Ig-like domain-containing protein [Alistipes sp.]